MDLLAFAVYSGLDGQLKDSIEMAAYFIGYLSLKIED